MLEHVGKTFLLENNQCCVVFFCLKEKETRAHHRGREIRAERRKSWSMSLFRHKKNRRDGMSHLASGRNFQ